MEAALKFTLTEYERDSVNWTGHDIIYKIKYLNLAVSLIIKKIRWLRISHFCNLRRRVPGPGLLRFLYVSNNNNNSNKLFLHDHIKCIQCFSVVFIQPSL